MRYLRRPDGRIAYDLHGPTDGPLVVCVPGMGDVRTTYRHLPAPLAGAGYRVAAMDLRSHGDSDTTFTSHTTVDTAEDTAALIGELGGPATVVGNSLGATAAAWTAATRPALVNGLVLSGAFLRGGGVRGPTALALKAMLMRPWGPAMAGRYLGSLFSGRTTDDHPAHTAAIRAALRSRDRYPGILDTFRNAFRPVPARLDDVRAPALVVMGEQDADWPDPAAEAAWMRDRLGAELLMVPEAGHYPLAQRPDITVPALLAFLATTAREAGRA
ncbi:alpha/beta fold hydrolase [Nocardiopsis suaedae]|uniref:Alpha/beta hydrolase n=1 Tax=Nocardiopsis suaedae TaxID=3018444 RepID=A0ABT4TST0_9ACTN|nr:alpha/beta hydrolase [Nocardiopsis suaedae]MDA2807761.1 alpha/beta hydrolase [Nocardiopsis suaedae]